MPDPYKTVWQDMHGEAAQELDGIQTHGLLFTVLPVVFISEAYSAGLAGRDPPLPLNTLTFGAVPVSAGVVRHADVSAVITRIDMAAQKGVLHKNTAARRKSRLVARVRG